MRSRFIKPEICLNHVLGELDPWAQMLYTRLLLLADREGRFEYRPRQIWAKLIPYFRGDVAVLFDALCASKLIRRYEVDGVAYADIPDFREMQYATGGGEPPSKIPPFNQNVRVLPNLIREAGR